MSPPAQTLHRLHTFESKEAESIEEIGFVHQYEFEQNQDTFHEQAVKDGGSRNEIIHLKSSTTEIPKIEQSEIEQIESVEEYARTKEIIKQLEQKIIEKERLQLPLQNKTEKFVNLKQFDTEQDAQITDGSSDGREKRNESIYQKEYDKFRAI